MFPSLRALTWSVVLACGSTPIVAQWEYEWAFQSIGGGDNNASVCRFAPDGSILLAGGYSGDTPIEIGGITWYSPLHPSAPGYIAKLDPTGIALWAHFIQEQGPVPTFNAPFAIATDSAGNVFIGGNYTDSLLWDGNMILTDTTNDPDNAARSMYVVKMDPAGDPLWSIGMSVGHFMLGDLVVNDAGDIILAGASTTTPDEAGRLMKLSGADGAVLFDHIASSPDVVVQNLGLDSAGNIFAQGWNPTPFTLGGGPVCPYNNVLGSNEPSIFAGKFDPMGVALWYHVPDQGTAPNFSNFFGYARFTVGRNGSSRTVTGKAVRFGADTIADGQGALNGVYALDPDGALQWHRTMNTTGAILVGDVERDHEDLLIAGAIMNGPVDIGDTVITTSPNGVDVLLLRLDGAGELNGLLAGPYLCAAVATPYPVDGLAIDDDGLPAICGTFVGTEPVFGPDTLSGAWQSFLARVGPLSIPTGGIEEPRPRISLFPNPTDRSITVDLGLAREANAVVYDASGSEVWSRTISSSSLRLDVSTWPNGIYHIRMVGQVGPTSARFVVAH